MASIDDNEKIIDDLNKLMQDCINKEEKEDAIIFAQNIVHLSNIIGNKKLTQDTEKLIVSMQKELKKKYKNTDVDETLEFLQKQKKRFSEEEKFNDAIRFSEKIKIILNIIGRKKSIQEEDQFIELMEEKKRNIPSKLEIIDKIDNLKGIKEQHSIKQKYLKAIDLSKEIIKFAKIAGVDEIIKEEENSIQSMQKILQKEQSIEDAIQEFEKLKDDYKILVKYDAIKQAHGLMEKFSQKYAEIPRLLSEPNIEKAINADKKQWINYQVERDKKDKEQDVEKDITSQREIRVKLELERVKFEEEKARLRRELAKVKRQQEYSETGQAKAQLEGNLARLEKQKQWLEIERKRLKEKKEKIESGKLKEIKDLRNEIVKLQEINSQLKVDLDKYQIESEERKKNSTLNELEKTEIEEAREKLSFDTTRFMEGKEELITEKLNFEEEMTIREQIFSQKELQLEEGKEKLEWEKLKFQQDKENIEKEKMKLEEDKKKFKEIKKKLSDL